METCTNPNILSIIYYVKSILKYAFILLPVGLILMTSIDIAKNVMAGKEDEMKKNLNIAIKRIIYCVIIFFIPTITNLIIGIVNDSLKIENNYLLCWENAEETKIQNYYEEYTNKLLELSASNNDYQYLDEAYTYINKIKDETKKSYYENTAKDVEQTILEELEEKNKDNSNNKSNNGSNNSSNEQSDITNSDWLGWSFTDLHESASTWLYLYGDISKAKCDSAKNAITNYSSKKYVTEDKKYYKAMGNFYPYGYMFIYNGKVLDGVKKLLEEKGVSSSDAYSHKNLPVEAVDYVTQTGWKNLRDKNVESILETIGYKNSDFEDYQLAAFTDLLYNFGPYNSTSQGIIKKVAKSYKTKGTISPNSFNGGQHKGRYKDLYTLFTTGKYEIHDTSGTILMYELN